MNSDFSQLSPEDRDLRLTALILGELPAAEAQELRAAMENDPELRQAFAQREKAAELLASALPRVDLTEQAPTRLSDDRREKLLAAFAARPAKPSPIGAKREPRSLWYVPLSIAAVLIGLLGVSVSMIAGFLPLGRAKARAQRVTMLSSYGHEYEAAEKGAAHGRKSISLSRRGNEAEAEKASPEVSFGNAPLPNKPETRPAPVSTFRSEVVAQPALQPPADSAAPATKPGSAGVQIDGYATTGGATDGRDLNRGAVVAFDNLATLNYNVVPGGTVAAINGTIPPPAAVPAPTAGATLALGDAVVSAGDGTVRLTGTNFTAAGSFFSGGRDKADIAKLAESSDREVKTKLNRADSDSDWRWAEPQVQAQVQSPLPAQMPAAKSEVAEAKAAPADPSRVQLEGLMEIGQVDQQLAKGLEYAAASAVKEQAGRLFDDSAFGSDRKQLAGERGAINNVRSSGGGDAPAGFGRGRSGSGPQGGAQLAGTGGGGLGGASGATDFSGRLGAVQELDVARNIGQGLPDAEKGGKDQLGRRQLGLVSVAQPEATTSVTYAFDAGSIVKADEKKKLEEFAKTPALAPRESSLEERPIAGKPVSGAFNFKSLSDVAVNGPVASTTPSLGLPLNSIVSEKPKQEKQVAERLERAKEVDAPVSPKPAVAAPIPQPEVLTRENAFSTFSLNVADVSFKLAAASLERGAMPDAAAIRSEEFINAFDYRDPQPAPGLPIAFASERARYPFAQNRDVLRLSVKTAAQGRESGKPLNVVILLDNSGSMERADRIRITQECLRTLASQFKPQDKLSVVTFARTARLWVDGISGTNATTVAGQVGSLTPEGGTNLEDALDLAYRTALRHHQAQSVTRVVLLTDGAANLGNVDPNSLKAKVESYRKQGVALDSFGIGWEGYNDDLLETLTRNGDGRYGFINTPEEAGPQFAAQLAGALRVAASDVKVQIEFNPRRVSAWRQIGYAKHQLTKEQFRDNTVDAAEIGAAEAGNALYVIETKPLGEGPIATVRVRYKDPGTADYHEQEWQVAATLLAPAIEQASPATRLATAAAGLSEWLAGSPFGAEVTTDRLLQVMNGVPETFGADPRPRRLEWMIRQAKSISGK